jgi:hypothetical protein
MVDVPGGRIARPRAAPVGPPAALFGSRCEATSYRGWRTAILTRVDDVVFGTTADGRRSTSVLGRAVVADALRAADPAAADAAGREPDWRRGYLRHFRALVEAGLTSDEAAYDIARAGLASVHSRMRVQRADGDISMDDVFTTPVDRPLRTLTIGGAGRVERELSLPLHGRRLRGAELHAQLAAWVTAGVIEASCAAAVGEVAANPDWLDLSDHRVVALGAGSEMGPVHPLLRWGATVVGVDLPRPEVWARIAAVAGRYGGRLIVPVAADGELTVANAGVDLLGGLPAIAQWLTGVDGRLVLGTYVYADGATHVRLAAAADALGVHLRRQRHDAALAFLATPTDVFAVPADAVDAAGAAYRRAGWWRRQVRAVSGGRLLVPNYPDGCRPAQDRPGVNDSLVPQQGPNYALAKRIQRWRATAARQDGVTVALSVAPPTRTRSVLKSRALAAAYAGAHRFGVEVFEPATSNTLMAALLVHQLRRPRLAAAAAWTDEAFAAAHGGLWRIAYRPRSALGLAAVAGLAAARR